MPLSTPAAPHSLIVPVGTSVGLGAAVWPTANRALYMRFAVGVSTPIRYVNWRCDVQSGNVQLGVVSLTATAYTAYTRVANSGVIACPAAGDIRTDLGSTLLAPGTYAAFLWADNVTFQARLATNSGLASQRVCGIESSLAGGVTASGTVTWSTTQIVLSLESG